MKKNVILALVICIAFVIVITIGLSSSVTQENNQPQTNEKIPAPSVSEGKSIILKLDDSVSTSTP